VQAKFFDGTQSLATTRPSARSVQTVEATYIGKQLKAARKLREIETTKDLEDLLGKPRFGWRVIGKIERNERAVSPHEIDWLAEALELPTEFFTNPPPPAERVVNGDAVREAAAGEMIQQADTALADALARFTDAITQQNDLLARQSAILERIERALGADTTIRDETREATQRLLETVAAASPTLRDDAQSRGASPSRRDR
jgi:hypothetical protein